MERASSIQVQQEAQDELLSALKGEMVARQGANPPVYPEPGEGAFGKYVAVVAQQRGENPYELMDQVPAVPTLSSEVIVNQEGGGSQYIGDDDGVGKSSTDE